MLKISQYLMTTMKSIWSQLEKAVDLADSYNTFVFDGKERQSEKEVASAAADIFQHFKKTTDSTLLGAMLENPQLQYILKPIEQESAKRLPHLSYAWNVQTIVQDMMCISNKFGASANFKTDLVHHRNAFKHFFAVDHTGDIALLMTDDIPCLRKACGGKGSGLCDIRTETKQSAPKDCHTVAVVVSTNTRQQEGKYEDSRAQHHEFVYLAQSLNAQSLNTVDFKSYSYAIPKTLSESRGALYKNIDCFVVGTSNVITFAKCMIEGVPCALVHGNETILYKPIGFLERETHSLKGFIETVCEFNESPTSSLLALAQQSLLSQLDECCSGIVNAFIKHRGKNHHMELLILVEALQAVRKKLAFIFENLNFNDILFGYLGLDKHELDGRTSLEALQGFNNTNVRFLRRMLHCLSTTKPKSLPHSHVYDKTVADKLQEQYVADVLMANKNDLASPKWLLSCSCGRGGQKADNIIPVKYLQTAEMFFELFGMNPDRILISKNTPLEQMHIAHVYQRWMYDLSKELSVADEVVTNLELFDGEYKANHEEYFSIWIDLVFYTKKSQLNVKSCVSAVAKPRVSVRGLNHAYDICKKYEVVAQSHYLHEVSSINEYLKNSDRLLDILAEELEKANIKMRKLDDKGEAFMSQSFKANVIVEEAIQAFVARLEKALVPIKYNDTESIRQAYQRLESIGSGAGVEEVSSKLRDETDIKLRKLCDRMLQSDHHRDSNICMACIALHNFVGHDSCCMQDLQDRIMMLASFQKLMMTDKTTEGGAVNNGGRDASISDKLRAYAVKMMNAKTDVIIQCTFVAFLFVVANGIFKYYEQGSSGSSSSSSLPVHKPTAAELMKQIIMNTVLMAGLANFANHVEVELCVYAMYFAYVGMAIMRLLKTS